MNVKTVRLGTAAGRKAVKAFCERPAFDPKAERAAAGILSEVKRKGNRAVLKFAEKFDGACLRAGDLRVGDREIRAAAKRVPAKIRSAIRTSHRRITAFARAGMRKDWRMRSPEGGTLGEQFVPLDRVGVYVPGGVTPLVSTALMTATLAKAAGVPEIVACTPARGGRELNPALLHALAVAGATEIYRVGGVHSIGLMAYGTGTVRKVQKIVGPGATHVTAAKRQVYGTVALDLVAGPSEIAILADSSANCRYVAADLLSQAEHGSGFERVLLVTTSKKVAERTACELETQAAKLGRAVAVRKVLARGALIVVVGSLDEGMEVCNRFAPEHLEIMVKRPSAWLKKVKCAGAVFLGPWSPEAVGDYVAGPSHVLPTGGTAGMFSGLTVDDFRRRTSFIAFSKADLKKILPVVETFGAVEKLDAHARSASIRFD
ncbi:histidinol dehydrogenase [Verrucomicrobiota bacterium]